MNEPHIFRCNPCRADRRLRRAWKRLPALADLEDDVPVDEAFVGRVLAAWGDDRRRRAAALVRIAAAAALLFFFFAGAGGERAASTAMGTEQAYAQLDVPSGLDGLLPD